MGIFSAKEKTDEISNADSFIFVWKKNTRSTWHLVLFILFSTLVHGSGFYLFQVVYPEPVRVEPTPDHVTILDYANPAVRSTVQRAKDRTVFLQSPSKSSNVRVRLADHAARLTPAFTKVKPTFLPPRDRASLIPPPSPQKEFTPPDQRKTKLILSPNFKKRGIAPWSILRDYLGSAEGLPTLKLNLSVLPDGKIKHAKVLGRDIPDDSRNEFNNAVKSTLRFQPITSDDPNKAMEGWVEIRPEKE